MLASPLLAGEILRAQTPAASEATLLDMVNVWDFAKLAQRTLDPVAWATWPRVPKTKWRYTTAGSPSTASFFARAG